MTMPLICLIKILRERQESHEQPGTAPKSNEKYMVKTLNTIVYDLCGYIGEYKIPLAYVVCDEPAVAPEADNPSTNYKTTEEEIIARAPHTQGGIQLPTFASDNQTVADILSVVLKDANAWTWKKESTRVCNIWSMFTNLKNHYPGASKTDNIFDGAELLLCSIFTLAKSVILPLRSTDKCTRMCPS